MRRVLQPFAQVRPGEETGALLMFAYAFLAMTAYNIIQPLTRSKFIASLGSINLPYVLAVQGVIIALLMVAYTRLYSSLPRKWALPLTLAGMGAVMVAFWAAFQTRAEWVSVAFYIWGALLGILLTSQFWTLANGVYDPRQAKRLFGFIGGGIALGGATGAGITAALVETTGTNALLLIAAIVLVLCAVIAAAVIRRETSAGLGGGAGEERGVSLGRAFELLRRSKQVQIIAAVIAFGSIGAALIDQQLSMATEIFKGRGEENAIGAFLAQIRVLVSLIGFVLQVWVTPRIHRYLGIGFALMILPTNLGLTAAAIIVMQALGAPALASVSDRSIRYSVDKTTREVLFLPLPTELRQEVKAFVDVTVERGSRGAIGLIMLVLIQPWGFALQWWQLSFVSTLLMVAWYYMANRAKHQYLKSFRESIERRDVRPGELRINVGDLATIEALVEELASPDERRVLYAIDLLESLDKRNLVTPLLLYHEAARVRARALLALGQARPELAERWLPAIQRMIGDPSSDVRTAAVAALANISSQRATDLVRPYVADPDPRIAATAAAALARSDREADLATAADVLRRLGTDMREGAAQGRRDVAAAIRHLTDARFRHMLIPLLHDPDPDVAAEAMRSVAALGASDDLFVPALVSLLRHRTLKSSARDVLVAYGENVLDALNYFLRDPDEDIWVRRHLPATMARIPSKRTADLLIGALGERDGFLRFKVIAALEKLHREQPDLILAAEPIVALAVKESRRYFTYLTLHYNLFVLAKLPGDGLLARALSEKMDRLTDRMYRLLGLLFPWKDIAAARWAIARGEPRARASALEYLDNLLSGDLRKYVMPVLEEMPLAEKVTRANVLLRTRPRDVEETLLQLINEDDQIIAAAAIDFVEDRKIWSLAGDLEHILAHRDPRHWHVFEAASWALAASRMPDTRRRTLWVEPLPSVQLAARLRLVPLFALVSLDELFRLAGAGRQVRYETAATLYQQGAVPDQVQFLLDGTVSVTRRGEPDREVAPPAALALEQVLEGTLLTGTVRTIDPCVCLAITSETIRTLIADNTDLVQGLLRMLADAPQRADRTVVKGRRSVDAAATPSADLKPIEKVLVLQAIPLFSGVTPEEMLHLAAIAREVPLAEGSALPGEAEPTAAYVILDGEVVFAAAADRAAIEAHRGDVVGIYETLAGTGIDRPATVRHAGRALRVEREELFDTLAMRPHLLEQLFDALLRREGDTS